MKITAADHTGDWPLDSQQILEPKPVQQIQ